MVVAGIGLLFAVFNEAFDTVLASFYGPLITIRFGFLRGLKLVSLQVAVSIIAGSSITELEANLDLIFLYGFNTCDPDVVFPSSEWNASSRSSTAPLLKAGVVNSSSKRDPDMLRL